jgi:hypothetical protein
VALVDAARIGAIAVGDPQVEGEVEGRVLSGGRELLRVGDARAVGRERRVVEEAAGRRGYERCRLVAVEVELDEAVFARDDQYTGVAAVAGGFGARAGQGGASEQAGEDKRAATPCASERPVT